MIELWLPQVDSSRVAGLMVEKVEKVESFIMEEVNSLISSSSLMMRGYGGQYLSQRRLCIIYKLKLLYRTIYLLHRVGRNLIASIFLLNTMNCPHLETP